MWQEWLMAMALVLVIEGLLPAINPDGYKRIMATMLQMNSRIIRGWGLFSMILGTILLYILKN